MYLKTYLAITKKQWNGAIILVVLAALVLAAPYGKRLCKDTIINAAEVDKAVSTLQKTGKQQFSRTTHKAVYAGNIPYTRKPRLTVPLELNSADSAALTTVYGIGPSFARRIIKYRNILGGFAYKHQLKEVYGLDAEKYREIEGQVTVDAGMLKRVNVNTAEFEDMRHVPYISFKQMNAIIQYRIQHGNYNSADDMLEIAILDREIINKIKPYIRFK